MGRQLVSWCCTFLGNSSSRRLVRSRTTGRIPRLQTLARLGSCCTRYLRSPHSFDMVHFLVLLEIIGRLGERHHCPYIPIGTTTPPRSFALALVGSLVRYFGSRCVRRTLLWRRLGYGLAPHLRLCPVGDRPYGIFAPPCIASPRPTTCATSV